MPLHLLRGLLITDAQIVAGIADLRANYLYFDAVPVHHDNSLSITDIALSVMVNSRISGNTAAAIFDNRNAIDQQLALIPDALDLIDVDNPAIKNWWNPLVQAISTIDAIYRVDVATATKTLHKKRPGLITLDEVERIGI